MLTKPQREAGQVFRELQRRASGGDGEGGEDDEDEDEDDEEA